MLPLGAGAECAFPSPIPWRLLVAVCIILRSVALLQEAVQCVCVRQQVQALSISAYALHSLHQSWLYNLVGSLGLQGHCGLNFAVLWNPAPVAR
jgi:hypothetical protein